MTTVYTHCRTCLSHCGVAVQVEAGQATRVAPDKDNPYNWHDFCAKARTAPEFVAHPRRIRVPMRRVGDRFVEATWEEAISAIAGGLRSIMDREGPDAIGAFWGNPASESASHAMFCIGLLDAIGTRQRYWAGSVDQNNYHVVSEALYNTPVMVTVPDVDRCDCFLMVGMNPAESGMWWLEVVPGGWQRVQQRVREGADLIVVDPRRTPTAEKATTHVAIRPGQDWAFLLGLVKVIFENGWESPDGCAKLDGVEDLRALAVEADLDGLSARCDVPVADIVDVSRRFATARTAVCMSHTGVSQHVTGTIGEYLAQALNHLTNRIDQPGGRRFERGYVDTIKIFSTLSKPMEDTSRVRRLPAVAGYRALAEMADEITTEGPGRIRAMIIDAGNPVVTGPQGAALDEALGTLELLVVVDLVQRESHRHAHWLIPGTHWLERGELMAFASGFQEQPFVQYATKAVEPPPGVREEWSFFTELALAMKVPMFGFCGVNTFIKATRALARMTRRPGLAFHPEWISRLLVATGRRVKWRDIKANPHGFIYGERDFGYFDQAIRTPDKRVRIAPPVFLAEIRRQLEIEEAPSRDYPLVLINRRTKNLMNSHSTDLPGLNRGLRGNEVEVNPVDAERLGVRDGTTVRVTSPVGALELPARVTDAVRPGVVMIQHGYGSRVFDPVNGSEPIGVGVNRNLLTNNSDLDPLSMISPLNGQRVRVEVCQRLGKARVDLSEAAS